MTLLCCFLKKNVGGMQEFDNGGLAKRLRSERLQRTHESEIYYSGLGWEFVCFGVIPRFRLSQTAC